MDRATATVGWQNEFLEASITHLPMISSDHRPILINVGGEINQQSKIFHSLNFLCDDKDFLPLISNNYNPSNKGFHSC